MQALREPFEPSRDERAWKKIVKSMFRTPRAAGACIFLLAFFIRIPFTLHTPLDLAIAEPKNIGISLLEHKTFANPFRCPTGPTAHENPFLPVVIAGIYSVFGKGDAGELARCILTEIVLCLSYALLPWIAVRMNLPLASGVAAGLICALFPFKRTSETVSFTDEPFVAVALLLLAIYCYWLLRKKTFSWSDALWYGLAWGGAFYLTASLLPVFIATLILIWAAASGAARFQTRKLAISLAGAILVAVPWSVRNYVEMHSVGFMRSDFGLELSASNNDGVSPSVKQNQRNEHEGTKYPLTSATECYNLQQLGEGEYNHRKLQTALAWIRTHPLTFTGLVATRVFYFWGGDPLDYTTAIPNGLLSIAGLAGCILLLRARLYAGAIMACAFLFFPVVYYLVQTTPRYTLPIHPLVALCAGYALYSCWATRAHNTPPEPVPEKVPA
ncbi:MAG TPA: hypothetical protein VKX49_15090 [Bryobacteraceae bacterium]|nr:hypothetical protein [Bryobacteraceae bacterium]